MTRARTLLLALALACAGATAEPVRTFGPESYREIVAAHAGAAFLLVFWSLDCVPCHRELRALAEARPALPVVLVATDQGASGAEIRRTLNELGVVGWQRWVFGAGDPRRLRAGVDPAWYGEVPRNYLFDADHRRRTVTGPLDPAAIMAPGRAP